MADYEQERPRTVESAQSVQGGEQVRRRMSARRAAPAAPAQGGWAMSRLGIRRAVDTVNARRRELLPQGSVLAVNLTDTTAVLKLARASDGALLHKSRPLPLANISHANVNALIRDFLQYKSLSRYENPLY